MDALSVPETYFWREIDQIRGLVVPRGAGAGAAMRGRIRIWSAPCATGEEPLTIAMVLEEAGWFDRAPIEIHASDGSPAAIAKARAGALPGALVPGAAAGAAREILPRTAGDRWAPTPSLAARITLVERRQPDGAGRSGAVRCVRRSSSAATCSSISRRRRSKRVVAQLRRPRCRRPAICASARRSRCCSVTVGVRARGDRRRVRVRETECR